MRSTLSGSGDPWPPEMVISIEDNASQLFELLWIREAYGLHPAGEVPPPLVDGVVAAPVGADGPAWEAAWPGMWDAAVAHAARVVDARQLDRLRRMAGGSPELAAGLRELRGPDWRDRFGRAELGAHFEAWSERHFTALVRSMRTPLRKTPEHLSMPSLIAAWRAGLTKVVTIPCRGEHTRAVGGGALLVTEAMRSDPERYSAALDTFR